MIAQLGSQTARLTTWLQRDRISMHAPRPCAQGMAIMEDMASISEEEPLPIIRAYIDLNLLTLHQVRWLLGSWRVL